MAKDKSDKKTGKGNQRGGLKAALVISMLALLAICYLLYRQEQKEKESEREKYQQEYNDEQALIQTIWPKTETEFSKFAAPADIYNEETQRLIRERIDQMIAENSYTQDMPLVIYNPFGTNTLSAYLYFETETPVSAEYYIHVTDTSIPDFHAYFYTGSDDAYVTKHEYQMIGLVAGANNMITIRMKAADGTVMVRRFYLEVPGSHAKDLLSLSSEIPMVSTYNKKDKTTTTSKESEDSLLDGLYTLFGKTVTGAVNIYLYDNNGILRGELPTAGNTAKRLLFDKELMYYDISDTQVVSIDRFGQVVKVFDLGKYRLYGDFAFGTKNDLLILATDTTQSSIGDILLSASLENKAVTELVDFEALLPEYKLLCKQNGEKLDWLQLNSLGILKDGEVFVSSRETSSVMKLKSIYEAPSIDYMIGYEGIWKKTSYKDLLLYPEGEYELQTGQNTVTYMEYDKIRPTRYYLYLFNNRIGTADSRPDFNWYYELNTDLGTSMKEGNTSYYYRYMIDEAEQTVRLMDKVALPYAGYDSGVQWYEQHLIANTAGQNLFTEYDTDFHRITVFEAKGMEQLNRVFKYDFYRFYLRNNQ